MHAMRLLLDPTRCYGQRSYERDRVLPQTRGGLARFLPAGAARCRRDNPNPGLGKQRCLVKHGPSRGRHSVKAFPCTPRLGVSKLSAKMPVPQLHYTEDNKPAQQLGTQVTLWTACRSASGYEYKRSGPSVSARTECLASNPTTSRDTS